VSLTEYVKGRRWFRAKAKGLVSATVDETFPIDDVALSIVLLRYDDGSTDRYVLAMRDSEYDVLADEGVLAKLLEKFKGFTVTSDKGSKLVFRPYPGFAYEAAKPRVLGAEQTNTSVLFGDRFILKVVRKLDEGTSAELEMGDFLTRHGYASAPPVMGAIELGTSTVGILHRLVPNRGDAWTATLKDMDAGLAHASLLGKRVGEMHVVLAGGTEPAFAPEAIRADARKKLAAHVEAEARAVEKYLRPGDLPRVIERLGAFAGQSEDPIAMRVHGDLHLGQILATADDFVIIDFEGEPSRTLAERKAKRSPLADVAGMLRSFDYAAATALKGAEARAWYAKAKAAFEDAYRTATRLSPVLALSDEAWRRNLDFFLFEKAIYEIGYEANNRPDWIAIPQGGVAALLDA
jgi:predicted trehalose synthase